MIAILTPDPGDELFHSRWPELLTRLGASLGRPVEGVPWTRAADLGRYDLVLPLLAWGYPRAHGEWLAACARWEEEGVRMRNPPSVLAWNSDKAYLARLEAAGAPVVPTLFAEAPDAAAMAEAARQLAAERLVAKPRVSSSAWRTVRWSPGESFSGGPEGAAMIQPYLPSIESEGEVSLLFFGGRFSHAIRKRPQPGDFRVQPEHRGIVTPHVPAGDEMEAAERVLAAVDEPLLYARVDLVRGADGAPLLIELELVEPDLYLQHDPAGGALLAEAAAGFDSGAGWV